jgi:hypothetical protein
MPVQIRALVTSSVSDISEGHLFFSSRGETACSEGMGSALTLLHACHRKFLILISAQFMGGQTLHLHGVV